MLFGFPWGSPLRARDSFAREFSPVLLFVSWSSFDSPIRVRRWTPPLLLFLFSDRMGEWSSSLLAYVVVTDFPDIFCPFVVERSVFTSLPASRPIWSPGSQVVHQLISRAAASQ